MLGTDALRCPACAHGFAVQAARSLGPSARPALFADTLHRFRCPACQILMQHERTLVYLDAAREQFVHVQPPEETEHFAQWEPVTEAAFRVAAGEAPAAWRQAAARFRVRLVFGRAALREKLCLWDAGYDDALVELMKRDLQLRRPALPRNLRVREANADGLIIEAEATRLRVPAARYRRFQAARPWLVEAWPILFSSVYIDVARLPPPPSARSAHG